MKALILTATIMFAVVVGVYLALDTFLMDDDFAASAYEHGIPLALASLTLLATPYVHQRLSARRGRVSFTALPPRVERLEDYLLPPTVLFFYGVSFLYVVSGVAIVAVWLFGQLTGFYITRLIAILDFVLLATTHFLVGAFVGRRAIGRPYWTTIAIVATYASLAVLNLTLFRSSFHALPFALATVFHFLAALAGTWWGRRVREAGYARYLLSFVPRERRLLAADAFYETVRSLRTEPKETRDSAMELEAEREASLHLNHVGDGRQLTKET